MSEHHDDHPDVELIRIPLQAWLHTQRRAAQLAVMFEQGSIIVGSLVDVIEHTPVDDSTDD